MVTVRHSIGCEAAVKLGESKWWECVGNRAICQVQLFTVELCVPFDVFHHAVEQCLGRPVLTHEFGMNYDGIVKEFLGVCTAPTMREIIDVIPAEKRVLLSV